MPRRQRSLPTVLVKSHFQPTRSSNLSIPTSPTSPRSPLSPQLPRELGKPVSSSRRAQSLLFAAPTMPLQWKWHCHLCGNVYKLGVTRRCLIDGHMFCNRVQSLSKKEVHGEHMEIGSRKRKRRQRETVFCESEFDYTGWEEYNRWRREVSKMKVQKNGSVSKRRGG